MVRSPDLLARAYATLELSPGCSQRDATRQYKRLVKRWHPDRYAHDPQGQAEAALRLREINRAFALIRHAHRAQEARPAPSETSVLNEPPRRSRERYFGQRLSEAELQQIADAIGSPRYFATLMKYAFWAGSLVGFGVMMMAPRGQAPKPMNVAAGILLLSVGAGHLVRTLWLKKR